MKEFESCTTNAQVLFNELLRSARNQIGYAFGRLKACVVYSNKKDRF